MLRASSLRLLPSLSKLNVKQLKQALPSLSLGETTEALFYIAQKQKRPWEPAVELSLQKVALRLKKLEPGHIGHLFFVCQDSKGVRDQFWPELCTRAQSCAFSVSLLTRVLAALAKSTEGQPMQQYEIDLLQYLVGQIKLRAPELSVKGLAVTLTALAKFDAIDPDVLEQVCAQTRNKAAELLAPEIANMLLALAKAEVHDVELKNCLCAEVVRKATTFSAQDIADLLNAMAKSEMYTREAVTSLCVEARQKVAVFKTQELANVLSALVNVEMGNQEEELFSALCAQARDKATLFKSHEIASIFGVLPNGPHAELLAECLSESAIKNKLEFNAQDIASILSGLAKFGVPRNNQRILVDILCVQAIRKMKGCSAQTIAKLFNALGTLGASNVDLVAALCMEARTKLTEFSERELSSVMNALATQDKAFAYSLCVETARNPAELNARGISNILTTMASLGVNDVALVTCLCEETHRKVADFSAQDIASTLHALAKLGVDPNLVSHLCIEARTKVAALNPQSLIRILRALVILRVHDEELVARLRGEAIRNLSNFDTPGMVTVLNALTRLSPKCQDPNLDLVKPFEQFEQLS